MNIINTRRQFIQNIGKGLLGCSALNAGLIPLLANAQVSPQQDYKALICINLAGGNDAFNTCVPMSSTSYNTYSNIRRELAIGRELLHPLNPKNNLSEAYGFHPSLMGASQLFNNEKLALVANLGNLQEPVSKAAYFDGTAKLPPQLFSHKDQAVYAQILSDNTLTPGWAGRIAEALSETNINQQLAMNITISGDNYWQRGSNIMPFAVKNSGVNIIDAFSEENPAAFSASRAKLYRQFLNQPRLHLMHRHYTDVQMNAWVMAEYVNEVLKSQPEINSPIMHETSTNGLSQSLAMAAKMISANAAFQVKRQIFYINLSSFDTHRNQAENHAKLLAELDKGLTGFYEILSLLGLTDQVTVFTLSEFGRTLTRNGNDGTDHGWAGHHLVMGGAVKGQEIYGDMPQLELGSDDDVGEGRMIPRIGFDQYGATLSEWFGVAKEDIDYIFYNIKNFDRQNIGFFK